MNATELLQDFLLAGAVEAGNSKDPTRRSAGRAFIHAWFNYCVGQMGSRTSCSPGPWRPATRKTPLGAWRAGRAFTQAWFNYCVGQMAEGLLPVTHKQYLDVASGYALDLIALQYGVERRSEAVMHQSMTGAMVRQVTWVEDDARLRERVAEVLRMPGRM